MIYLYPNSANEQFIYLTLQEMKKDLPQFTKYLIVFENMASKDSVAFIGDVEADNERYTKISLYTNELLATSSRVLITETGFWTYKAYGQNSTTNLDPTNVAVVGVLEEGTLDVFGEVGYAIPSITIPDNYVYYE